LLQVNNNGAGADETFTLSNEEQQLINKDSANIISDG
jgi:hypothetical protein